MASGQGLVVDVDGGGGEPPSFVVGGAAGEPGVGQVQLVAAFANGFGLAAHLQFALHELGVRQFGVVASQVHDEPVAAQVQPRFANAGVCFDGGDAGEFIDEGARRAQ